MFCGIFLRKIVETIVGCSRLLQVDALVFAISNIVKLLAAIAFAVAAVEKCALIINVNVKCNVCCWQNGWVLLMFECCCCYFTMYAKSSLGIAVRCLMNFINVHKLLLNMRW